MYLCFLFLCVALLLTGCSRLATKGAVTVPPPAAIQLSTPGVDAAEPGTASASDGTFYVAWANHDAKQADIMIARFNTNGDMQGSPVRVNRQPGIANDKDIYQFCSCEENA